MSEEVFEQPGLDPHDGLHAPDLAPLRVAAQREELAEAEARLADGLGHPLLPGAHNPDGQGGIAVSWTTHDMLALDWERGREHQGTRQTMNRALANVLTALGYQVRPFGTGGASLVTGSSRSSRAATRFPAAKERR